MCSVQYIKGEEGRQLRDNGLIRDRWVQWFTTLLSAKSPALDLNIVESLKVWPLCIPLDDLPFIFEVEENIKSMSNRKAAGPDELPVELLNCSNSS